MLNKTQKNKGGDYIYRGVGHDVNHKIKKSAFIFQKYHVIDGFRKKRKKRKEGRERKER